MYILIAVSLLFMFCFKKIRIKQFGKKIHLNCIKKTTYFFRYFQTILAAIKPSPKNSFKEIKHQKFKNSKATIDWVADYNNKNHRIKILIILPGLTGNYTSNYIIDTINTMKFYPYKIGVYNYPLMSNQIKQGDIKIMKDLQIVVNQLKQKYKISIQCIGFSYGANQLLYYLGKSGKHSKIEKGVIISNPFHLNICSKQLGWFYNKVIKNMLVKKVQSMKHNFKSYNLDFNKIKQSKSVKQFDEHFTIKVYNYPSVEHYYQQLSSSNHIEQVQVPLLSISSQDDQICTIKALPKSDKISYLVTCTGGHVGFVDWTLKFWFLQPMQQFLTINSF